MKKTLSILLIFLWIQALDCSGQTYPTKFIINKDTVIALTIPQANQVNVIYELLDGCKEERDSMKSIAKVSSRLDKSQKQMIDNLRKQLDKKQLIIDDKVRITDLARIKLQSNDKQIQWLKSSRLIVSVLLVFTVGAFVAK